MNNGLDDVDRKILDILREDGRVNIRALADQVDLPETTARDRLHRLEREKYVRGYKVVVDPRAVGMPVQAWVIMDVPSDRLHDVAAALWRDGSVVDGFALPERPSGLAVRLAARDTQRLGRVLERWRNDHGIEVRDLLLLDDLDQHPVGLEEVEWDQAVLKTLKNQF